MKKPLQLFVTITALLFAFSANSQNFVQVKKTNAGQTINLATDQVLEVQLPRTPSTGYIWCEAVSSDKKIQQSITQIGDGDFVADNNSVNIQGKKKVGQSGTQIIRYTGTKQGSTELSLELRRPWEKSSPALDNFTITIVSGGKYTGSYTPPVKEMKSNHVTHTPKSVPSSWDWRSQCTPVTNQQQCGDCWAFAGTGTLEANIDIIDGVVDDISEAYVTNCFTGQGSDGCNGGWCPHAIWLAPKGAVYEADEPWTTSLATGTTGTCQPSYPYHEYIDGYADVAGEDINGIPPDANMKFAIYYFGPIWVALDASSGSWNGYSGGIYTETGSPANLDHATVLVGWKDSTGIPGGGYWILRNSWGTGWGVNGYMYITYGSDIVGSYSDFIVYKGGIPHAARPIADFIASDTTSCTGTIHFTDLSANVPASWLWDFGDGQTATVKNPSHTYITNGTYAVSLKATNSYGDSTVVKLAYININMPASPVTTGGSTVSGGSVTLYASGPDSLKWYDAATGGNLVNTGTSLYIPSLTADTTFYVENDAAQHITDSVGMAANTSNGNYYSNSSRRGLVFDAYVPFTIDSVTVYEGTAGTRTISLEDNSGTVIDSVVTAIATGTHTIALNFGVPAGTGYRLVSPSPSGNANALWRETSGAVYPYTLPGVMAITGNTAGSQGYYFFFNWKLGTSSYCNSPRVPVTATIITGISDISDGNMELFPNPNAGVFDISLKNKDYQNATVSIMNVLGEKLLEKKINGRDPIHIDVSGFEDGVYFVELRSEKSNYIRRITITK